MVCYNVGASTVVCFVNFVIVCTVNFEVVIYLDSLLKMSGLCPSQKQYPRPASMQMYDFNQKKKEF